MKTLRTTLAVTGLLLYTFALAETPRIVSTTKTSTMQTITPSIDSYSEVVDCGSVSQGELFRRARLWLVQTSATEPLALSDQQTGDLAGRFKSVVTIPRSESSAGGVFRFRYTLLIECANRKYRATIVRIEPEENSTTQPVSLETYCQKAEKSTPGICAELDKQLKGVLASLHQAVTEYKPF
ncbi:DUF4468 domain-containing protein [Spirosoma soli]|uniref:DUF4468 domain-containing protein n=1 Tax=Spirosoma soli TaxID=1770529 RepID=A0ABW5MB99_9BACT